MKITIRKLKQVIREAIESPYTGDKAFDAWFDEFSELFVNQVPGNSNTSARKVWRNMEPSLRDVVVAFYEAGDDPATALVAWQEAADIDGGSTTSGYGIHGEDPSYDTWLSKVGKMWLDSVPGQDVDTTEQWKIALTKDENEFLRERFDDGATPEDAVEDFLMYIDEHV